MVKHPIEKLMEHLRNLEEVMYGDGEVTVNGKPLPLLKACHAVENELTSLIEDAVDVRLRELGLLDD